MSLMLKDLDQIAKVTQRKERTNQQTKNAKTNEKKHTQKKTERGSERSDSEDDESDSDRECNELFRGAGRRENGLASKIARVATRHPGRLMRKTVQSMYKVLNPGKSTTGVPPVLNQFLQQAMIAHGQLEGRNLREVQTIALAGDAILQGRLEEGLEILLQRWKRVEAVATGTLSARAAEHLELLPPTLPTSLSLEEREECAELSKRWTAHGEKSQQRGNSPG